MDRQDSTPLLAPPPGDGVAKKQRERPKNRNGGRPISITSRNTRAAIDRMHREGKTLPLDVMLDNMLFWKDAYQRIQEKFEKLDLSSIKSPAKKAEALKLLDRFLQARQNAQVCAVEAAPYCHPKLASITMKGDAEKPILHKLTGTVDLKALADEYARTLDED